MHVAIAVFDGVDELNVVGPYEVFDNAAREGADVVVQLCALDNVARVAASHGLDLGLIHH